MAEVWDVSWISTHCIQDYDIPFLFALLMFKEQQTHHFDKSAVLAQNW